jgi:hypothetical protein
MNVNAQAVEYFCAMPFFITFSALGAYYVWFEYGQFVAFNDWLTKNNGTFGERQRRFQRTVFARWFARIIVIPFLIVSAVLVVRIIDKAFNLITK